jgi:hypothetical protein
VAQRYLEKFQITYIISYKKKHQTWKHTEVNGLSFPGIKAAESLSLSLPPSRAETKGGGFISTFLHVFMPQQLIK